MGRKGKLFISFALLFVAFLLPFLSTLLFFSNWTLISSRRIAADVKHDISTTGSAACSSIWISLATFGTRVFKLEPTIRSLMDQSLPADMILVHVALTSRAGNVSKDEVLHFATQKFGFCSTFSHTTSTTTTTPLATTPLEYRNQSQPIEEGMIIHCGRDEQKLWFIFGQDFGPATKVLGTLQLFPASERDACIISVDDDVVYDTRLVQVLVANAPSDHGALGFSCEEIPFELELVRFFFPAITPLWWHSINMQDSSWRFPFDTVVECKGWLQGYQGILYHRSSFSDDVFSMNATMPDGCFYADDVRLSGYLWSKGIKRYVHPHFESHGCVNCGSQEKNQSDALSLIQDTMTLRQWPCVQYFDWKS